MDQEHHLNQLDRLLESWEKLGQGERNILMVYTMRLLNGQRKFGKLNPDKKDWTYEALEEALDYGVYMACALHQKAQKAFQASLSDTETEVKEARLVPDADCTPY